MIDFNKRHRQRAEGDGSDTILRGTAANPEHSHATWVAVAIGGSAVIGAGASMYNASQARDAAAANAPGARNLGSELTGIQNAIPGFNQQGFQNQQQYNGQLTGLNTQNFNNAFRGNFDRDAYEAAHPGFTQQLNDLRASGELQGWTDEQFALANSGNDQSQLTYSGGIGQGARDAFNSANPALASYTAGLGSTIAGLNANAPRRVDTQGYTASTSAPQNALTAAQSSGTSAAASPFGKFDYAANGNVPTIAGPQQARDVSAMMVNPNTSNSTVRANQGDIGLTSATQRMLTGGPSDIQQSLEQQARSDLALGGSLSQEQQRNASQAAREAGAARGLINSNSTVAAEILNRDAASTQRLNDRRNFAAAVDTQGFGQRQQGFTNALGVSNAYQNYGAQNLAAQQSNQTARTQANAMGLQGQIANQNTGLQAGQANQSADLALNNQRFQVGQANQNAGLAQNQLGLGYAQLNNNAFQSGADRQQQGNQFNATLGQNNNQYNAGQQNATNQFNSTLGQQNNQYNAAQFNGASQFNANAQNQMGQFNAQQQEANNNDAWARSLGYGTLQGQQALNPLSYYGAVQGQAPDYTQALLGYGSDLYNTNYNGASAASIAGNNNAAALTGAGLGLIGSGANAYANYAGRTGTTGSTGYLGTSQNGGINPATGQPWG